MTARAGTAPAGRVFRALPPTPGARGFAQSWWGRAWITALEQSAMDTGRLRRGRTYARSGAVGQITAGPGRITAHVRGSMPKPYTSTVSIRTLSDTEWERLLDAVAAKAGHIAALLDRDMPEELVQDAADAGVRLLPHPGELTPACTCPDWGDPCKHAAAVCYQISRILDTDPFVLLLLRGRDETAIMNGLRRRNTADTALPRAPGAEDESEHRDEVQRPARARDAFATAVAPATSLPLPGPVAEPGPTVVLDSADQPPEDLDPIGLEILAADAALRAKHLLERYLTHADESAGLLPELDTRRDLIRILAQNTCDMEITWRITMQYSIDLTDLTLGIEAWRQAGAAGLEVYEQPWTPSARERARATALINEGWGSGEPPVFTADRNRWTFTEDAVQLRYGRDQRWYPYAMTEWGWTPVGRPNNDAAAALDELFDQ